YRLELITTLPVTLSRLRRQGSLKSIDPGDEVGKGTEIPCLRQETTSSIESSYI
ncbi:hypothetical protein LINPERPRIM_LOCUS26330, partial [Linum perenne]